jgi:hypothetical protein
MGGTTRSHRHVIAISVQTHRHAAPGDYVTTVT